MVMANLGVQGRFLWQGLMTVDPAAAGKFYGGVVGWKSEPWSADPSYTLFSASTGPVAGMSALPEANRAQGARGNWMTFIGSDDVDATVSQAEKLGSKLVRPASDMEQIGRIAILTDPQGASFAVFKPLPSNAPPKGAPKNGEFAWHELSTPDPEAALKFYQELFGWQLIQKMDMGPIGFYYVFGADGVQRGGMFKPSHPTPGAAWLGYVEVADADKTAVATTKAGGHVLNRPMDVPGGGRIAQLADAHGVPFAVHSMGKPAAAPAPKPSAPAAGSAAPKPAAPKPSAPPSATAPATRAPTRTAAAPKPAAPKPAAAAAPKPAAAAPAKAAPAPKKKVVARKKAVAKKKAAPRKAVARKSAAKPARKTAGKKKVARKAARKVARKVAKKGKSKTAARKAKRGGGKARRKK